MSGFLHSHRLKRSLAYLLLWILVWPGTGSTPNLFGQQTQIVIHPLPDGNFRLSASPVLGTAIVVEFKKQGETVEGGGYHIVTSLQNMAATPLFCFKGRVKNGEIVFTRALNPNNGTNYIRALNHIPLQGTVVKRLTNNEISPPATEGPSNYGQCEGINGFFDQFEKFVDAYKEEGGALKYLDPVVDAGAVMTRNAAAALELYKQQRKKAAEEIIDRVIEGTVSSDEANAELSVLEKRLLSQGVARSDAFSRGMIQFLEGDPQATWAKSLNAMSLRNYKKSYELIPALLKATLVKELVLRSARKFYEAQRLSQKLGKAAKALKVIDTALLFGELLTSDNQFRVLLKYLVTSFASEEGILVGQIASRTLCFLTGPGLLICSALLTLTGAIALSLAASEGFDLIEEWWSKPAGLYEDTVFTDAYL